jgi:hypothetical protein
MVLVESCNVEYEFIVIENSEMAPIQPLRSCITS